MALPSSGSISIAQVATELGLSLPLDLNDSRVRTLAGKPTGNITLPNDLWGKSSRSYSVAGGFIAQSTGGSRPRYYDRGSWTISKSPASAPSPTAWSWFIQDMYGEIALIQGANTYNLTCRGQEYNLDAFNQQGNVEVYCTVTVEGVQYTTPSMTYIYTASGFA